jgi:DNA-binding SARP family transcriptional activator
MYLSLNQFDRAIKESKTALQYDPSNETALYRLILALRHSGRGDDLQPLVKRLSELHRESLQHETDRKKYRLVEQESATSPQGANH